MARVLALSGTPGVGKTSIATALSLTIKAAIISIGDFVKTRDLYESWDAELSTRIVDEDKAREAMLVEIDRERKRDDIEWLIIEGLLADIIADKCDVAIVLRLDPRVVKERLEQRGYDVRKVAENVQAELLGTCTYHMQEAIGNNFIDLDTTGKNIPEIALVIAQILNGKVDKKRYKPGLVDWIARPDIDPGKFF